jgi:hypothetical protein
VILSLFANPISAAYFTAKIKFFQKKSDLLCLLRVELLIVQIVENLNVIFLLTLNILFHVSVL